MPRVEAQPLLFVAVEATIGVSLSSPNECVDRRKSPGRYARQPFSNKGAAAHFQRLLFLLFAQKRYCERPRRVDFVMLDRLTDNLGQSFKRAHGYPCAELALAQPLWPKT